MNNPLIQDIKTKLNIEGGVFIDAEIESYIKDIQPNQYLEFFKALSGDAFEHKNKLDRIAIVAKRYSQAKEDALFGNVKNQAKQLQSKYDSIRISLERVIQKNRARIPSNASFMRSINYQTLHGADGKIILSQTEYEILEDLGGGDFLLKMPTMKNSKEVTDKIEAVLKHRIRLSQVPAGDGIAYNVRKAIA